MRHLQHIDAQPYSTFRLAATFADVWEVEHLHELCSLSFEAPPLVLGEGSNSIFLQNIDRAIVRYRPNQCVVTERETDILLHVDAGHNWHQLVEFCVGQGWWGLENLALIPGSVGAAPVQNIGAYGAEFADSCEYVDFFEWQTGQVRRLSKTECRFSYRDSIFKQQLEGSGIIVAVGLKLMRQGKATLNYQGLDHLPTDCQVQQVFEAVIAVRESKLPDPKQLANCGSFFKNPVISAAHFSNLRTQAPHIPGYVQADGNVKIPAAWLLEQCGFKGSRHGDIGCYERQPLVLVNHGAGTSAELAEFVQKLQQKVQDTFAVRLEAEVRMYRA